MPSEKRIVLPSLIAASAVAAAVWAVRRSRADRIAYESRLTAWAASEAVLAERLRIARDLHDIVSHGLGLITVRAAATRHLPKPAEVASALTDIEDASRHATAELRRMLTVLREPSAADRRAPVDNLDDLPGIVRAASLAGLRTRLTVEPLGPVSQGVQVAERFGGGRLVVAGSLVNSTESDSTKSDSTKSADITGTVDGTPYTEKLWLYRHSTSWPDRKIRWFVSLGPNRGAHPKET